MYEFVAERPALCSILSLGLRSIKMIIYKRYSILDILFFAEAHPLSTTPQTGHEITQNVYTSSNNNPPDENTFHAFKISIYHGHHGIREG